MTKEEFIERTKKEWPECVDVEAVVLGTLINQPKRLEDVIGILRPEDFFHYRHRLAYEIMLKHHHKHGKAPDYMVLCELLEDREDLRGSDLAEFVSKSNELLFVDLLQEVRLIIGTSWQRQIIAGAQEMATIGYTVSDPDQSRSQVEKLLYNLTTSQISASDFEPAGVIGQACLNDAEQASKNRGRMTGLVTGYGDLDTMTGGLQRTDLILLAARPSMGKTSLAMNIAYNAARKGNAVAVFSLEMGKKQLGNRLLSLISRIPSNDIRSGWVEGDQWDKLVGANDQLDEICLHIDDTAGPPVSSVRTKLRRLRAKIHRPIDLVVLDYIGLMESEDESNAHRENRNQEISQISRGLKGIAREFDVPMLALAQLSRAVEGRQSKIPQLSDLRDSGSLEQDADVVMFIYRDDYYAGYNEDGTSKSNRPGTADVVVAKHRNGPIGEFRLRFDGALTRFDNLEYTIGEGDENA